MTRDAEALAYRRLAAAIVRRAMLDAMSSNGHSAEARRWLLADPWAGDLLEALGVDRRQVVSWVDSLEPLVQFALDL